MYKTKIDEDLKNKILRTLQKEGRYLSVNYLSNQIGAHWTKIYTSLLALDREEKIKTLKTPNGFFAILNPKPEQPSNCGGCQYFDGDHYCKLIGNFNLYRDRFTKSCHQALPKNIGGEKIVR